MARVFVIDDEESIRYSFKHFLTEAGHNVITAGHVIDAKSIINANEFDVVIIDRILPDGNGMDLIEYVSKLWPNCATIMMSAYPNFVSASKAMEHNTFAYLTKPVKKDTILPVVEDAVKKVTIKKESDQCGKIFQSVFSLMENGIIVYDLSGQIKFVNSSFSRMFGFEKEKLIGGYIFDVFLDIKPKYGIEQILSDITDLTEGKMVPEKEGTIKTKESGEIIFTLSQSVCMDNNKNATDILTIIRDITEKRKMKEQIHHNRNMETVWEVFT